MTQKTVYRDPAGFSSIAQSVETVALMDAKLVAEMDYFEHLPGYTDEQLRERTREANRNAFSRWNRTLQNHRIASEEMKMAFGRLYARTFFLTYREQFARCQHEQREQAPVERVMFRCTNKKCRHVWAREYYRNNGCLFRVDGIRRIYLNAEQPTCPKCNWYVRYNVVEATVSEHTCDDRCIHAKGPVCVCGCGGKNHGVGWLLPAAS